MTTPPIEENALRAWHYDIEAEANEMERDGARALIALFASGGVGETLQSIVVPWEIRFEGPSAEARAHIAEALLHAWSEMGDAWRLVCGIDGRGGHVVLSLAELGETLCEQTRRTRALPWASPNDAQTRGIERAETVNSQGVADPDVVQRWLIIVLVAGAAGDRCRTVRVPWDAKYERPGEEPLTLDQVRINWGDQPRQWRFAAAVDGRTGRVLVTPTLLGQAEILSATLPIDDPDEPRHAD